MAEDIDQSFAAQIADGCAELLAKSDLIVARRKDDVEINSRTIVKGGVADFVKFIVEEKQEDEEVVVWTSEEEREKDNWTMRYPVRMKAFYKEAREAVTARRLAAFESVDDGFTLQTEGRSGYLYYRDGARMLEMYVEMSGTRQYNFILYWEGLERWIYPDEAVIDTAQKARLVDLTKAWLNEHDYTPNSPE